MSESPLDKPGEVEALAQSVDDTREMVRALVAGGMLAGLPDAGCYVIPPVETAPPVAPAPARTTERD